jgi:hypothetical protein
MEKGPDCLPVVIVDGQVKKIAEYPTNEELATWTKVKEEELAYDEPKTKLNITLNPKG